LLLKYDLVIDDIAEVILIRLWYFKSKHFHQTITILSSYSIVPHAYCKLIQLKKGCIS